MLPSRLQYSRWSLPNKYTFWATMFGVPLSVLSLVFSLTTYRLEQSREDERNSLLFQAAKELHYNDEWLGSVARAIEEKSYAAPVGRMKTEALLSLVVKEHKALTQNAYGEEKSLYQLALRLSDLSHALPVQINTAEVADFNRRSDYTLHDIHFLNNFLFWYIRPLILEAFSRNDLDQLGWEGLPGEVFTIRNLEKLEMKYFLDEDKPIREYAEYLGLID